LLFAVTSGFYNVGAMDSRLQPLFELPPAWLQEEGPDGDVVVASRVRLARNLDGMPFPSRLDPVLAEGVRDEALEILSGLAESAQTLDPATLEATEREFLVERSLASSDLVQSPLPTGLCFEHGGVMGVMVHEEDHFRIQGFAAGLDFGSAFRRARGVEAQLRTRFTFATHARFGYLTACPTNTGSGLRASLLLHLPALARLKSPLQKALQAAQKAGLAVRGVHGEGSRAMGHLYQISNQRTLGEETTSQMEAVAAYGREIVRYERSTRRRLLAEEGTRRALLEDVRTALSLLQDSTRLTTAEALDALSTLRLGVLTGLLGEASAIDFAALMVLQQMFSLQPGHLQARMGKEMDPVSRDRARASLVRESLRLAEGES